jgi:hypothetical protein
VLQFAGFQAGQPPQGAGNVALHPKRDCVVVARTAQLGPLGKSFRARCANTFSPRVKGPRPIIFGWDSHRRPLVLDHRQRDRKPNSVHG